ncbi:filamentous hemagglutinin N-terminal domain-containing protein [Leptolyngbya sp. CCY15150]|uniref:two-partner secretion domain-containing protein n=1 Tax=Leptolyngbya sp. CCY15150 TaxID=2767772 RepID=UPI001950B46B|nr:filamentous hemagglutinin N-terminal domain-containing protein [Leptolyngbya sp. CCY15150]
MNQPARVGLGVTLILSVLAGVGMPVHGQIIRDASLGAEPSRVVRDVQIRGAQGDRIEGGAQRGGNLFHSFREFNVGDGQRVYFTSPAGVDTILTRVTGTSRSDLLGTLGVDGTADLFLMNPNGVFFGPNARLDVSGSFVATTADAIQLGNGEFSARSPQVPAQTLRVDPSAFVFNQLNRPRGEIVHQAIAPDPNDLRPVANGLSVPDGRSLILLGGDVILEGGYLRASGGRVELGGLVEPGTVTIRSSQDGRRLRLTYPDAAALGDVTLTDGAIIDVTGAGRGDLSMTAGTLSILSGSNICGGLGASSFCGRDEDQQAVGTSRSRAGNVVLVSTDRMTISGANTGVRNRLNPGATGNTEDIFEAIARLDDTNADDPIDILFGSVLLISGDAVTVSEGAQVSTSTNGQGNGGLLYVLSPNVTVESSGVLDSNVLSNGRGQAGGVFIGSSALQVTGGSSVESGTDGRGPAGRVLIQSGTVEVSNGARLSSAVFQNGVGRAGGIAIETNGLVMTDGGSLNSSTFSRGPAGAIVVVSNGAIVIDNARIDSAVGENAVGQGGQIRILGQDTLILSNGAVINTSTNGVGQAGDIVVATASDLILENGSFILSLANVGAQGNGGEIGIGAGGSFIANSGSGITTLAVEPDAAAGDLFLAVNNLFIVTDRSFINAATGSGDGGNLFLTGTDFLILANASNISTSAGQIQGGGDGGNIELDIQRAIFAIPFNDNNIRAEAFDGDGGNIRIVRPINLQDIAERPDVLTTNDITASSEFGVDGIVNVNELDVDPIRGLNELPTALVNAEDLVTQECPGLGSGQSGQVGAFYVTGRGGIPTTPDTYRGQAAVIVDWAEDDRSPEVNDPSQGDRSSMIPHEPSQIPPREFQGWQRDETGQVWLVAEGASQPATPASVCPSP